MLVTRRLDIEVLILILLMALLAGGWIIRLNGKFRHGAPWGFPRV